MNAKPKLLLVDKETAIVDQLKPFLSRAGFEIRVALDSEVALTEIISYMPNLVILEILMSGFDVYEVLRQLRQTGDLTLLILLRQASESAERTMALMEGADDHINKPFGYDELVSRIKAVL